MYSELDTVVLNKDIKEYSLKKGDVGTIVHLYKDSKAVEVEFMTEGKTIAVLTLKSSDIRKITKNEIFHVRDFPNLAS